MRRYFNRRFRRSYRNLQFAPTPRENNAQEEMLLSERGKESSPTEVGNLYQKLSKYDLLVVMILWTSEILFVVTEAWRNAITRTPFNGGILSKDMIAHQSSSISFMVCTSLLVITVSNGFCGSEKLVPMLVGLTIYFMTPVFGVMLVTPQPDIMPLITISLQTGWYASTPMRYWLIFHQKIPLPANKSLLIASLNEFLKSVAVYGATVYVEWSHFINVTYLIAFAALFVVSTAWMMGLVLLKNYYNSTADSCWAIRDEYESNELSRNYKTRQRKSHLILFLLILLPSAIFPATREMVTSSFEQLPNEWFIEHRLDLMVYVASIPVITLVLFCLRCIRHEVRPLLAMSVAHLMNLVVVSLFFTMIPYGPQPTLVPTSPRSTTIDSWTPALNMEGWIVTLVTQVDRPLYRYAGRRNPLRPLPNRFSLISNGTGRSKIEVYDASGSLFMNGSFDIGPGILIFFATREKKFVKVAGVTEEMFRSRQTRKALAFHIITTLPECPDGPEIDSNGRRGFLNNEACHSFYLEMKERDASQVELPSRGRLNGPKYGTISERMLFHPRAEYVQIQLYRDNERVPHQPYNEMVPRRFVMLLALDYPGPTGELALTIRYIDKPLDEFNRTCWGQDAWMTPVTTTMSTTEGAPVYVDNFDPFRYSLSITSALVLSGLVTGVTSVVYLHFIWIQNPCDNGLLIIGCFVVVNYIGGWAVRHFVSRLEQSYITVIMSVQLLFLIWHGIATAVFWENLPALTAEERKMKNNMSF